ncbi:MAG: ribosomal protein S18-alanine N-acetyltransferase [Gemmatimonadota bacterium]
MSAATEIAIRDATLADVDAIVAIERSSFSDPWSDRSFRELVGREDVVFEVAVAGAGDAAEVIGYAMVYLAESDGDLANIATAPRARRQGMGRRLLRHALASARARGAHVVFLEVRESNHAARALYESEGFTGVGRRARYYAHPVEDALILRKELR